MEKFQNQISRKKLHDPVEAEVGALKEVADTASTTAIILVLTRKIPKKNLKRIQEKSQRRTPRRILRGTDTTTITIAASVPALHLQSRVTATARSQTLARLLLSVKKAARQNPAKFSE